MTRSGNIITVTTKMISILTLIIIIRMCVFVNNRDERVASQVIAGY